MSEKNGYARLKARFEKLQEENENLKQKHEQQRQVIREYQEEEEANAKDLAAYKRKCKYLQEEVERIERARDGYRKAIENYKDREDWLLRHTLGIIRFWYVKHFGL